MSATRLFAVVLVVLALWMPSDRARAATGPALSSGDDLLPLLTRDRQTLSLEYRRLLQGLERSRVPSVESAEHAAIRHQLASGGVLAEEATAVVALLRSGVDVPSFANKGDLVWVVRISHIVWGVTQELWISSTTSDIRAMLPGRGGSSADGPAPFRYCYSLFEVPAGRSGCSDCYIPILVTRELLDRKEQLETVVIVTYERDSVWTFADQPVKLERGAVQAGERKVRFEGKVYRYQRVPNEEVIRLLEHPFGTLPIHRPALPIDPKTERLRKVLLRDLSAGSKAP